MANSVHRLNSSSSDVNFKLSCDSVLSKLIPPEKSFIDCILTHNDSEQAEIVLPDGRTFGWYFAIGSMTNPISLYLRDLIPLLSYPATCLNYKIVFRNLAGMADIEVCSGGEFDGVVHLLTNEQMTRLDGFEHNYHRIKINCIDYQGQSHAVYAYQMTGNNQLVSLPRERYLDVIVKGCEYYKVRPEYINKLKNEQPVIPRKQPDCFQSFTDFPSDAYYSIDDLDKHNGSDPSLPIWICVNGKILEYVGLPPADHPDYQFQRNFHTFATKNLSGCEATTKTAKALYEPLYKLPLNDGDICNEQRAQIEDHYYSSVASSQNKTYWKPIGRLRQLDNSS